PFSIGVAQGIAELPTFSGMGVRIVIWLIYVGMSIAFVTIYAKKVKANPKMSIVYEEDKQREFQHEEVQHLFTPRRKIIIGVLVATLIALAIGVILFDWYITEIAGLFLIMGIAAGLINKMNLDQIAESFIKGCQDLIV